MKKKLIGLPFLLCISIILWSSSMMAQKAIRGKITDGTSGSGLPGVTVTVQGTTIGTLSDLEGNYSLNVPAISGMIQFSMIGYETKAIAIGESDVIDMAMVLSITNLDEVVVVGYGTQSRARMSTAVSKVDTKVLANIPRSNVGTALQGTVAGLRVQNTSGQPGSTPSILLRGGTDWSGGSSPLVLVDGVISSLYALNSDDIESIEVLKDAAATAIYGARAANGIILITTKKGKVGTSQITYSYRFALNKKRPDPELLNAHDYIYMNRMGLVNYRNTTGKTNFDAMTTSPSIGWGAGGNMTDAVHTTQIVNAGNRAYVNDPAWQWMVDPLNSNDTLLFQDNDMSDLFYQNSYLHDHHLSISGGSEKAQYALGLGFKDDKGLVLGSEYKGITANLNSSYDITKKVKVSSNINFASVQPHYTYIENISNIFQRAAGLAPTSRIYNADGSPNPGTNSSLGNPLYYQDKFIRKYLEQRLTSGVNIEYNILPELKLAIKGGLFAINNTSESFDKSYISGGNMITERPASASYTRNLTQQHNILLTYNKMFNNSHNLSLLIGGEYYDYKYFGLSATTKNSPTNLIYTLNAGSEAKGVPSTSVTYNRILSTLGRVSYDFKSKYLLNINFRYDGSSKLANYKWGFFPGVSFGWNMHNESFFKNLGASSIISTVKPRVSYGVNGNVDNLTDFGVFGGYAQTTIYNSEKGYYNNSLPMLGLKWESSTTFDLGADLGFLNNRISLIVDYFTRDVYNKLAPYALPYETGFSSFTTNNGTLRNRGFEAELKATVIENPNGLRLILGSTFYTVKNFVVKLPDNGLGNNRQGGIEIFDPKAGKVVWAGGLQEGKRIGSDEVYSTVMEYVYADNEAVAAHATRVDLYYPKNAAGQNTYTVRFPGDVAWRDVDKNDTIDYRDRVFLGRTTPLFMGGLSTELGWKGFTLLLNADYAVGHMIFNNARVRMIGSVQGSNNSPKEVLNSWTPENRHTDMERFDFTDPRFNHGDIGRPRQNSKYWEKGDYLCLREATLSYEIPASLISSYVKNIRLYFTGANLVYFTDYSGMAPEQGGTDDGRFPMPRVYTFGLNVTF